MEKLLSFTNRIHSLGVIFKLRISWFLLNCQVPNPQNPQQGAEKERRQTLQRIKCSKQLKHKEHKIKNIRDIMDFKFVWSFASVTLFLVCLGQYWGKEVSVIREVPSKLSFRIRLREKGKSDFDWHCIATIPNLRGVRKQRSWPWY